MVQLLRRSSRNHFAGHFVPKAKPRLEALENRTTPALMTVTNPMDGGLGSLRDAIIMANGNPGLDTINFAPAAFTIPSTIALTFGTLQVTDSVIIDATMVPSVTITANKLGFNVFTIDNGLFGNVIGATMRGLTITGGAGVPNGGGVLVGDEIVTLERCTVTANQSLSYGGGILVQTGGQLTVRQSTISSNSTNTAGGGVFMAGNTSLLVDSSTLVGNMSQFGAGVAFSLNPGLNGWRFLNSTLSGNIANFGAGGGIAVTGFTGVVRIENCTITQNASTGAGGIHDVNPLTGTFDIESSIVGANLGGTGPDISAVTVKSKNNWLLNNTSITTYVDLGGNLPFGTIPILVPLANNGGPTQTHALPAGSPAINAGSNPTGLTTDQRGGGYVRGYPGSGVVDIGAFEAQVSPPRVVAVTINGGAAQRSLVTSVALTFDQAIGLPMPPESAFQLQRVSDGANVALSAAVSGGGTVVTLTFTGGAVDATSLADGRYNLKVLAAQIPGNWFDGNSDGIPGDDYLLTSYGTTGVFRLFGDADGNATVNAADFNAFRLAYGTTGMSIFDFDNNGVVNANDFNMFRMRYGVTLFP